MQRPILILRAGLRLTSWPAADPTCRWCSATRSWTTWATFSGAMIATSGEAGKNSSLTENPQLTSGFREYGRISCANKRPAEPTVLQLSRRAQSNARRLSRAQRRTVAVTDPPGEDQFVLLNDQPVDETDDDALGMAEAVSDLVGLILGSRGAAPFTLAIDAGWGMGKSSMMLQLKAALNGHRNQGVVTSWFNAWTAHESDALAGLIKSALMGEPEKALRRTLWRVARHRGLLTALHAARS